MKFEFLFIFLLLIWKYSLALASLKHAQSVLPIKTDNIVHDRSRLQEKYLGNKRNFVKKSGSVVSKNQKGIACLEVNVISFVNVVNCLAVI